VARGHLLARPPLTLRRPVGDVAQLAEHRLCKAGVGGSSPPVSTRSGDPCPRRARTGSLHVGRGAEPRAPHGAVGSGWLRGRAPRGLRCGWFRFVSWDVLSTDLGSPCSRSLAGASVMPAGGAEPPRTPRCGWFRFVSWVAFSTDLGSPCSFACRGVRHAGRGGRAPADPAVRLVPVRVVGRLLRRLWRPLSAERADRGRFMLAAGPSSASPAVRLVRFVSWGLSRRMGWVLLVVLLLAGDPSVMLAAGASLRGACGAAGREWRGVRRGGCFGRLVARPGSCRRRTGWRAASGGAGQSGLAGPSGRRRLVRQGQDAPGVGGRGEAPRAAETSSDPTRTGAAPNYPRPDPPPSSTRRPGEPGQGQRGSRGTRWADETGTTGSSASRGVGGAGGMEPPATARIHAYVVVSFTRTGTWWKAAGSKSP
jgi:hypothetical protein